MPVGLVKFVSRRILFAISAVAFARAPALAPAERQSAMGLNQRVLLICGKFNDVSATRMTAQQWVDTLNTQVNAFMNVATYGQTSYTFERPTGAGVPADGWLTLPFAMADWPGTTQACWDAIRAADPFVNMSRYNRVFLIVNNPGFGGQCTGYQWFSVDEGNETIQVIGGAPYNVRLMSCAFCNEWLKDSYWPTASGNTRDEGASVAAHEMGHELEIPIHYSDITWAPNDIRDSVSPWDVMGLSPTWNNYFAWSKFKMGWLPIANIQNIGPATTTSIDTTTTLNPLHATTGRRGIKIPFSTADPFNGYYVEYRKQVDPGITRWYGGQILDDGVLVTLIDDRDEVPFGDKALVMYNPLHEGDASRAMLRVGESFIDAGRGITITCVALGSTATVRVQYVVPPTDVDPAITPWSAPPYETPDIWIDSEQNGWGTYRYVDSGGRPIGNGDPAWVRHLPDNSWKVNRVMVRIRNYGLDPVTNVLVNVYVNDPPGLGDRGANWAYLGSINYPLISGGGNAVGYVNWAPQVDRHTCLRAVIVPYTSERTEGNNQAQENVSNFETTASSPYQPVTLKMRVQNPTKANMPTEFQVDGIPRKWKWELSPRSVVLPPDGEDTVTLTLFPPNPATNPLFVQGQIFVPRITALMPHGDAYAPVGGVEHGLTWSTRT